MRIYRFFCKDPPVGGEAWLTGADFRHFRTVLRLGPGTPVSLLGRDGREFEGTVAEVASDRARVRVTAERAAPAGPALYLAVAPPKGKRMDFLVQKAAELGVSEIIPISCVRSVVRPSDCGAERRARWDRIAAEAVKQSGAGATRVAGPARFEDLAPLARAADFGVIAAPGGDPLVKLLGGARAPRRILALVGPEGGWTPGELDAARAWGLKAAGLGRRVLRVETAAVVVAAAVVLLADGTWAGR
jgi:16S rRNA (uracil1498-N3)-methyltransferase